jgi:hypothetical protein
VQVYVDLRTGQAYAFGAMYGGVPPYVTCSGAGAVSGGRIAYEIAGRPSSTDPLMVEVRLFDIATRTERRLFRGNSSQDVELMPAMLALADTELAAIMMPGCPACNTLFLLPLGGGPRRQVYPALGQPPGGVGEPLGAAWPYLVFTDFTRFEPTQGYEVMAVDVRQPDQPINLSNHPGDQWRARISGTRVVWMDTRNDPGHDAFNYQNTDVYLKDIATGEERAICTDPAQQNDPDIDGDVVAWLDCRHGTNKTPGLNYSCQEPYVYNLKAGIETAVSLAAPTLYFDAPRLNGGRLFLRGGSSTDWNQPPQVYMLELAARGVATGP